MAEQEIMMKTECMVCKSGTFSKWTCQDCELNMCKACKKDHLKLPGNKHHKLVRIWSDKQNKSRRLNSQIQFKLVREYTIDVVHMHYITRCPDGTLWIGDFISEKIIHVNISGDGTSTKTMCTLGIKPNGLAISPSGPPFVAMDTKSTLQIINETTRQTIDSKYSIHPWTLTTVHTTRDENIIVGGHAEGTCKGIVILINRLGEHLSSYEKDRNEQLFTYPEYIVTTNNDSIFVLDGKPMKRTGRVVIIEQGGRDIKFYHGHPTINSPIRPFYPRCCVVTPSNNVLIMDFNAQYIHLLNSDGDFMAFYKGSDIGVTRPFFALGLSPSGNIYVGSIDTFVAHKDSKATLYELESNEQ